jgi:hypothetical protein
MKTRGLQNAINRLKGARKFGSMTLLAQAEREARQTLEQARVWMERAGLGDTSTSDERHGEVVKAVLELEVTLFGTPPR